MRNHYGWQRIEGVYCWTATPWYGVHPDLLEAPVRHWEPRPDDDDVIWASDDFSGKWIVQGDPEAYRGA